MLKDTNRILIVRTDKIGDVVLTTPSISALRKKFPSAQIVGLASTIGGGVYSHNPHLSEAIILDPALYSGLRGFWALVRKLAGYKFDVAVLFHSSFTVALAVFFSVPVRIGPYSRWWSWLLYNKGRRQSRSAVEMHEADYNLQLLREFGITVVDTWEKTYLTVDPEARRSVMRFFVEKGLSTRFKTVVIHPGMAGSALNWPESHYIALGRILSKRYHLIITGGPGEEALVDRIYQGISRHQSYHPDHPIFTKYIGENGLGELIALLDHCDGVVAPSTGPMHLAVALGKKVLTVFSPIKVQSALRWGPYGVPVGTNLGISPDDKASIQVPDVTCAENYKCALSGCIYYPCMPRISVEDMATQLEALLEGGAVSMFKTASFSGIETDDVFEEMD